MQRVFASIMWSLLLVCVCLKSAEAASIAKSGSVITYTAGVGESNHLVVSRSGDYIFEDTGVTTISVTTPCTVITPNRKVSCPASSVTLVRAYLGDGNDVFWASSLNTSVDVDGQGGNDTLVGGTADDTLRGGSEDDTLYGLTGYDFLYGGAHDDDLFGGTENDTLSGEGGSDELSGDAGDDTLNGGDGTEDCADYRSATGAVWVRLSLTTAQNTFGAGYDTISGIENLRNSNAGGELEGNSLSNKLYGGPGVDILWGHGGDDFLYGEGEMDVLYGGADSDYIHGGPGEDFYYPNPTETAGDDIFDSRDGAYDSVNCGVGYDTLYKDYGDSNAADCDEVYY